MKLEVSPKLWPKLQNSSLTDKRVHTAVCEKDVDHKVTSGKWVLERLGDVTSKARYVLRGIVVRHVDRGRLGEHHIDSVSPNAALVCHRPEE